VTPKAIEQLDLEVSDLLAGKPAVVADPYPVYERLRRQGRTHRTASAVLLPHFQEIAEILTDERALKVFGPGAALIAGAPPDLRAKAEELVSWFRSWLTQTNGQTHERLRNLVHRAFTAKVIGHLRGDIELVVGSLLDEVEGQGTIDFVSQFAYHLPLIVICRMLDIPVEDRFLIRDWSRGFAAFVSGGTDLAASYDSMIQLRAHIGRIVEARRGTQTTELLAALLSAEEAGDRLTNDELVMMTVHLVFGGHETTTHQLGNGLVALLRNRSQWDLLREEPSLVRNAVDELLRYDSPVQETHRAFVEDVELAGTTVRAGETVRVLLGSGNHDPEVFPEPERLDVRRPNARRQLGLGFGSHYCLGQALTRLEAEVAFTSLLDRFPDISLASDQLEWLPTYSMHGMRSIPVRL
jgi:cytochrome P450